MRSSKVVFLCDLCDSRVNPDEAIFAYDQIREKYVYYCAECYADYTGVLDEIRSD